MEGFWCFGGCGVFLRKLFQRSMTKHGKEGLCIHSYIDSSSMGLEVSVIDADSLGPVFFGNFTF